MSTLAFLAVLAALGLGVAWTSAAVLYPAWARAAERSVGLARTAVGVAALPWLLGAAFVAAGLLPGDPHTGQLFGCHCAVSGPGWSHLCLVHPVSAVGFLPAAGVALVLLLPGRVTAWRRLLSEPRGSGEGATPTRIDLPWPTALLVGWRRPSLVVDRRFWAALTPAERDAVVAHEEAHIARRDPAVLFLLRALGSIGPRGAGERLARAWLQRAEVSADARAAAAVGDPVVVAQALLRCARLGRPAAPRLAVGWTGGFLERRVQRLLAPAPLRTDDRPDVDRRDAALLLLSTLAVVSATPWVHHQLEHILNLSF